MATSSLMKNVYVEDQKAIELIINLLENGSTQNPVIKSHLSDPESKENG